MRLAVNYLSLVKAWDERRDPSVTGGKENKVESWRILNACYCPPLITETLHRLVLMPVLN